MNLHRSRYGRVPGGFSLIETSLASVLVAVLFMAAMNAAGASRKGQAANIDRIKAHALAEGLLAEIVTKAFDDPSETSILGLELSELLATKRSQLDDVDDFHNWTESPPKLADGSTIPGYTGWSRSVEVRHVNPNDPTQTSIVATGAKRITVTTTTSRGVTVSVVAVRTNAR